jgi:alpha-L-glutamate ligase-like protein
MKASNILGLNARAQISYRYNKNWGKAVANSKLLSKKVLKKAGIPAPEIYKKFLKPRDILYYDWQDLPDSFALKPSRGLGGEGIIVIKKRAKDGISWITTSRKRKTVEDLKLHTLDIFEGAYSMQSGSDVAFAEEYVGRHKAFRKYAYRGTPDIRVVVFNKVPVMAMLRLPTKDSAGRANLHQGAIGVGVDIATGITTKAVWYGSQVEHKPGTKRKLHGIKIPNWTKVLEIAVKCSEVTRLDFLGVDIVLHPEKGPMVLELNAQPGFQIQLANEAGLKKRLDRVEDLEIRDAEHGVNIAKILFAERFTDKVKFEEGVKTLKPIEEVIVYAFKSKKKHKLHARIDTGAKRTSIDRELARELGLLEEGNVLWRKKYAYRSATGKQTRPVIGLTMRVAGRKLKTSASVANRSKLSTQLLIGRDDLAGFLVDPVEVKKEK